MKKVLILLLVAVLLAVSVTVHADNLAGAHGDDLHPLEDVRYYALFQMREFMEADETGEFQL
jgi:hypothetical protein